MDLGRSIVNEIERCVCVRVWQRGGRMAWLLQGGMRRMHAPTTHSFYETVKANNETCHKSSDTAVG